MANSLINPHFFQPLLPGFRTHLNIPVAFFSKHVKGRNEQSKTAKLRSDASDKTWLVKIDGLKFTDGWGNFTFAHNLRTGDIVVFRHEGEMVFHVTVLGPSCCEIQYTSAHNINDVQTNIGDCSRKKKVKKSPIKKVESSYSDHSSFVTNVTISTLRNDRLYLPMSFARSNGLDKMNGGNIVLLDEQGESWKSNLRCHKSCMQTYVKPGWRRFCFANRMKEGDRFTFKLVQKAGPPVMRLCLAEHRPKSETSLHHSYFVGSVTASSISKDKLYLRRSFVSSNGLNKGCSKIVLKNEWGREWSLVLKHYNSFSCTIIKHGWASFCKENGLKNGDSFKFKLVKTGKKPILSLCPADSNRNKTPLDRAEGGDDVQSLSSNPSSGDDSIKSEESENESGEDKNISQCCSEIKKRKYYSNCGRVSSSSTQNRFVTLTLTKSAFATYKMFLPHRFAKMNGIQKPGKISLLGQDGVKLVVELFEEKSGRIRFGKGWRQFCKAQGVKIDESFVLELIWDKEANPALKFCNKL